MCVPGTDGYDACGSPGSPAAFPGSQVDAGRTWSPRPGKVTLQELVVCVMHLPRNKWPDGSSATPVPETSVRVGA